MENYKIDKLTAATIHIEAVTLLVLRNESSEAALTLLAAARTVLWDLGKTNHNNMIEMFNEAVSRMIKPGKEKEWRSDAFLRNTEFPIT